MVSLVSKINTLVCCLRNYLKILYLCFGTGRIVGYKNIISPIVMQINAKDKHVMFHGQKTSSEKHVKEEKAGICDNTIVATCVHIVVMLNSIMKEMNLEMT